MLVGGAVVAAVAFAADGIGASPSTLTFANADAGTTPGEIQSSTVTNVGTTRTVTSVEFTGDTTDFEVLTGNADDCSQLPTLANNQSCKVRVQFHPVSAGSKSATVTVHTTAGDPTVTVSGEATTRGLTAGTNPLPFGNRNIGDGPTAPQTSTITNTGSSPVDLDTPTIGGTDPGQFAFASPSAGTDCDSSDTLQPGDQCEIRVVFDPSTTGTKGATVTVHSDAPDTTIALSGNGTEPVLHRNHDLDFGSQDIDDGATAFQTSVVTNDGSGPATISALTTVGDTGDFVYDNGDTNDCKVGTELAPNATCDVRFAFNPGSTGHKSVTLRVISNAVELDIGAEGVGTQTVLSANPTSFDFGGRDIDDGPATDKTFTFTNSGPKTIHVHLVDVSGTGFAQNGGTCVADTSVLAPTESCTVIVRFDPATTGAKSGSVTVTPLAADADPASASLSGTGEQTTLAASPTSWDFMGRDVDDGSSADKTFTFTSTGPKTVHVHLVDVAGPGFERNGGTCIADTTTLTDGQSCTVIVRFDPSTTGPASGSVTVTPTAADADPASATLSGTGEQTTLAASPTSWDFMGRDVDDGPSADKTFTFTSTGPKTVHVHLVDVTGAGYERNGGTCVADTTTLTDGQSCTVIVRFDPTATGPASGSVTVTPLAADADPASATLSGSGEQTTLAASPTSWDFGGQDVDDGPAADKTFTFTSTGPKTVHVHLVAVTGAGFARNGGTCVADTTTLTDGQSCTVVVRFDPTATGPASGSVTVTPLATDADPASATLAGNGDQTTIAPDDADLDFGSQDVNAGPTATQTSTITNSGPKTVHLQSVAIAGDQRAQFVRLTSNGTDCTSATVLAPSGTCEVRVRFDPSYEGPKSANVAVTPVPADADPVSIALTGSAGQAVFGRSDAPLDSYVFDGAVNAVAYDSAGRTYVGGAFSSIGPRTGRGVKLTDSNDQPDPAFPDVDGTINAVEPDGSGGWFIGGSFSNVGGIPRANIAHILSSGALDTSWASAGANGAVFAFAVSGGDLFVGGAFTQVGGAPRNRIARLVASTGSVNAAWTPSANNTVRTIAADGPNIYAGGDFTVIGGEGLNHIAKLSSGTGDANLSFDPDADGAVNSIALDGTDVYAGGAFTHVGGQTRNRVARLSPGNGAADSWNPNADGTVNTVVVSGTDVYLGGAFTQIGALPRNRIARVPVASSIADGWDPGANASVNDIDPSGSSVYATGAFTQIGGQPRNRIARISVSTGLADSWNPDANGTANAVAFAGSDVYVGGAFTSVGGRAARSRLARLLPDGTVDPDWDPGANGPVNALLVSGMDVYVGGQFTSVGSPPVGRNRLARINTATGAPVDSMWNPDVGNNAVSSLALTGTNLFVGGNFTLVSGATHTRIAKVPTTGAGTADSGWTASATGTVAALATDGTNLYAGGSFITVNGGPAGNRQFLAKLGVANPGTLDPDWNPSANAMVRALALSGNNLFVGGDFTTVGGQTRNHLAKLSATGVAGDTGAADLAWDPNANGIARALAIAGSDIYAGGDFSQVGGVSHNDVVRLPIGDGGANDSGWNPIANGSVNALAATNTRLAVGGAFTTVHSQSRQGVALFDLPRLYRSPSSLQFGSQDLADGATATQTSTVTNSGTTPVTFSSLTLAGADHGEFHQLTGATDDCTSSTTLPANGTCDVRVQFDPTSTGVKSAFVEIDAPAMPEATIGLAGTGTHTELTRSPTSLSFGSLDIDDSPPAGGPSADRTSTVTNSGSGPITLTGTAVTIAQTASDFTRVTGLPSDCFDSRVLGGGETCNVRIRFNPTTVHLQTATATVHSDAGDVPIALDGTGIQTSVSNQSDSLAFGRQDIDDPATVLESTVTNTGTEALHLPTVDLAGSGFSYASGNTCTAGTTLAEGDTCKVRIAFLPGTVGTKSGSVTVHLTELPDITISLTGEGIQTKIEASPDPVAFLKQDIDDGAKGPLTTVVTNTGTEPVHINLPAVSGADFAFATSAGSDDCDANTVLAAGENCDIRVTFDPTTVGSKSGSVSVPSDELGPLSISLTGQGTQTRIVASPDPVAFGKQDIDDGLKGPMTAVVSNNGTEDVHINLPTISGTGFAFATTPGTDDCDASTVLAPGDTCDIRVTFDPDTVGAKSGSVSVPSDELSPLSISLSGEGTQTELSRSPLTVSFPDRDITAGPTAADFSLVTNSGSEPVTISSVGYTGDTTEFTRLTDESTDCVASLQLTAGQTCKVRAQFDPTTKGAKSATVTINSNAAAITVGLTGTGKQTELTRTPTSLSFGSKDIDDGATAEQSSTVQNVGSEPVTLDGLAITGADAGQFELLTGDPADCKTGPSGTLNENDTCKLRIRFNPSTVGDKTDATASASANGVHQDVALTGRGIDTKLSRSPATLSFGSKDKDDGPTTAQDITVANAGTEPVTITTIDVTGDFAQVSGTGTNCGAITLNAGDSCKLWVRFDPITTGSRTGTATVHSNAADVSTDLDGTGIDTALSSSPATLPFGSQELSAGATTAQTSTVTNTGTEPVDVSGVAKGGANPGQFELLSGQAQDCSTKASINASQTCEVRVAFNPDARGDQAATVTIPSRPEATISLTGKGIQTELTPSPASLSFGSKEVDSGATPSQGITITNTGTEPVTLAGSNAVAVSGDFAQVSGAGTNCANSTALAVNGTCKVWVEFNPSARGSRIGAVTVKSNAADVTVGLSGTGIDTELTPSATSLSFGSKDIDEGASDPQDVTITNTGTETVTLNTNVITGDFEQVSKPAATNCVGNTLLVGDTCVLRLRFDPTATGARSGDATIKSNAPDVVVTLAGTGIQTSLSTTSGPVAFGSKDIDDGPVAAQTVTYTNNGTEPVPVDGVGFTGSDPGEFQLLSGNAADCTTKHTITAGQTCDARITFDPSSTGDKSATLSVPSRGEVDVALTGKGIQTSVSRAPASLDFGDRDIDDGPGATKTTTLTNTGTQALHVDGASVSAGDFVRVTGAGSDCTSSTVLSAGQTCDVRVRFDPSTTGSATGTATVDLQELPDVTTQLTGRGTQTLLGGNAAAFAFGDQDVDEGPTAPQRLIVTNNGSEPVTLASSNAVVFTGDFAQTTGAGTSCANSTVLASGDTCGVWIAFDPTARGTRSGTVTVKSNAADVGATLSGRGIDTQLTAAPAAVAFGKQDIDDGASAAKQAVVTNTGTQDVTVTGVTVTGGSFAATNDTDCAANTLLRPGGFCNVEVKFDPASVGAKTGQVDITSNAGPLAIPLTGTGTQTLLEAGPASLALGSQDVDDGPTTPQSATLTNVGTEPVTLTGVSLTGGDFDRPTGAADDCASGTTLSAGDACKVRARFDPSSTGDKSGSITLTSNAADITVPLSGTGIQTDLSRDPTALDFGKRNVGAGATAAKESTFTNAGTEPIALSGVTLTAADAGQFKLLSGAAGDCAAGLSLNAGATCKVRAAFDPTSAGAKAAVVHVASNAGPDATLSLAGTGTPLAKLTLPALKLKAASTAHKLLKVKVTVANGTVKKVVVTVQRRGKTVGKVTLAILAAGKRTVTVRLTKPLAAGTYVTTAQGKDVFGNKITAKKGKLTLTPATGRSRAPAGGGGGGGGGSG